MAEVTPADGALQQRDQRCGGIVLPAHVAGVAPHQWQVVEVGALAVAIPQPAEDAEHFEMPLQAHQVEPATEGGAIDVGEAGGLRALPVGLHPCVNTLFRPGDVTVAQQRDQVVADRATHRILKIDDPRVVAAADHQVARMKIAVYEYLWLRGSVAQQGTKRALDDVPVFAFRRHAEVPLQEPGRHQFHLADQPRFVVMRQARRIGTGLHDQQGIERIAIQGIDTVGVQRRQHQCVAQIAHQHETVFGIGVAHLRHMQPDGGQACGHVQPRPDVFLRRRCVHHDPGRFTIAYPPIAAKAGVGRGWLQHGVGLVQGGTGPLAAGELAVGNVHRGHEGR